MIPRQSRQISFCNEFDQTSQIIPAPGGLVLTINNILVTIILIFFTIDGMLTGFSIPLVYPYLKDQIIGPDYQIIQCDQIDSLGSWQDQWCANHQRRIILSWLLIFVWFTIKGLFSTWLKEQKEKSRQQIESATVKNVKSDMVNKEINIVEVVTIE
ncbi:954_t:CDS:2 [Gigaspora margarita]|uniref:954_t:CDS:1 n=1 Tax=Gigaspora margarita TaxID=4874 RepID=A0ABN7W321_GIGMA|nr:954_t:CDS:2 [Gigaspora margarita]